MKLDIGCMVAQLNCDLISRQAIQTGLPFNECRRMAVHLGGEIMSSKLTLSRRGLLKGASGFAVAAGIGAPAIIHAQTDVIRIGHLTPRTGFLGPLGEYAVMAMDLAVDELNAAGGINGRKLRLIVADAPEVDAAAPGLTGEASHAPSACHTRRCIVGYGAARSRSKKPTAGHAGSDAHPTRCGRSKAWPAATPPLSLPRPGTASR
jgi:hypothetical protein